MLIKKTLHTLALLAVVGTAYSSNVVADSDQSKTPSCDMNGLKGCIEGKTPGLIANRACADDSTYRPCYDQFCQNQPEATIDAAVNANVNTARETARQHGINC